MRLTPYCGRWRRPMSRPEPHERNPARAPWQGYSADGTSGSGVLRIDAQDTLNPSAEQLPLAALLLMRQHGLPLRRATLVATLAGFRGDDLMGARFPSPAVALLLQRHARHLHRLGPRAVYETLAEIAAHDNEDDVLRLSGGNHLPPL